MNCISATGRRPAMAIPMAMPTIPDSASGVSSTRCGPYSACNPSVTRNTPPSRPMSSPRRITRSSAAISQRMASLMASTSVRSAMALPLVLERVEQRGLLLDELRGHLGIHVAKHVLGRRQRHRCRRLHGLLDFGCARFEHLLLPDFRPLPGLLQIALHAQQRITPFPLLQLGVIAILAGIVRGGVRPYTVGIGFDQRRPLSAPRPFHGLTHHGVHRKHIIAIDEDPRKAIR